MTNTVQYHLYVESKKYNKLLNITKKKQTQRYENKLVAPSGQMEGRRRGKIEVEI